VLKGIPPSTPPKAIQEELLALGFSVQHVIPMTAWRDKTPLPMHIIELDNLPQSLKIAQLTHLCYIKISVEPYKGRTVPPQCARCQQFYHVAANCLAPPACSHCAEEHCSWQCDRRFEPNFVPTCALCKMGEHGSKYRGCPYFRSLMDKETRNKPQPPPLNTNQINPNPPTIDRRQTSQTFSRPRPPSKTLQNFPPNFNSWSRPLNLASAHPIQPPLPFSSTQPRTLAPQPRAAHLNQCPDLTTAHKVSCTCSLVPSSSSISPPQKPDNGEPSISQNSPSPPSHESGAEPHSDCSAFNQPRPPKNTTKKLTQNNPLPTTQHFPTHSNQNSFQSSQTPPSTNFHQRSRQPPSQRLGNSLNEQQTKEFINAVRTFNPNFSFHYLLQSISIMLLQFTQHPYESALPIIFNTFLANLLGLPLNG
jgi:hypothetical protein